MITLLFFVTLFTTPFAQTDLLFSGNHLLAASQGVTKIVNNAYPLAPAREDWTILLTRVLTQYILWWFTDLVIIMIWKRKSWRVWLRKIMRKILFQWRPGAVFVLSCQPLDAAEAHKSLDGSEDLPGYAVMALTMMIDLSTLVSGALSLHRQWITNGGHTGWLGMNLFFTPVAPAIVSFISAITALCKASNRVRIILIVLGLIAWPAIYLPITILHDPDQYYIFTIVAYVCQLNPLFIVKLELVTMVLIGFDRVFSLPIVASSDMVRTGFPFPTLNTWAFAGPLLAIGIATLILAEASLMASYNEIAAYMDVVQKKILARLSANPLAERRAAALPMYEISDELILQVISKPPPSEVGELGRGTVKTNQLYNPTVTTTDIRATYSAVVVPASTPNDVIELPEAPSASKNPYKQLGSQGAVPAAPFTSTSSAITEVSQPVFQIPSVTPPSSVTQASSQTLPPNPVRLSNSEIWHRMMEGREAGGARLEDSARHNI
jgi:hypothetical protein